MLDSYENRNGYALTFGLTVNKCLVVLLGRYENLFGVEAAVNIRLMPSYAGCKFIIFSSSKAYEYNFIY